MQGTLEERFWAKVEKAGDNDCWNWRAAKDRCGYGKIGVEGAQRLAHRVSWQMAHGEQPTGCVCHSCDNPACVNPAHLWAGSHSDNMRDKVAKGRHPEQRKTHCAQGHEYTPQNTMSRRGAGGRIGRACRACHRVLDRIGSTRRREAKRTDAPQVPA